MSNILPDVEDVVGRGVALLVKGALSLVRHFPTPWIQGGARALFSKSWNTFEAASLQVEATQRARILELCAVNRDTAFGREHNFQAVRGWDEFRALPIRAWTDFAPWVRRMLAGEKNVLCAEDVFFYARSSGTTGEPKSIPITARYLEEFRHSRRVWTRQVAQVMPNAIRGHILTVHSPSLEGTTADGIPMGSITVAMGSGREDQSGFDPVPRGVFKLPDHATRYYLALRFALQKPISVMAAVNPSTLVLLCQVLKDRAEELSRDLEAGTLSDSLVLPAEQRAVLMRQMRAYPARARALRESLQRHGVVRPVDVWPSMAGALCWKGGSAPFYLRQLQPLLPGLPIMDYGYAASEGSFTVPLDGGDGQGVAAAAGHVLEFIPWDSYEAGGRDARGMWELTLGGKYVVVVTGGHGLVRYDMQDVVQVMGFHHQAPILAFLHKAGSMVSITGEKLAESQVVEAVAHAAGALGLTLRGFTLAPELAQTPRYVLAAEPDTSFDSKVAEQLAQHADDQLQRVNMEYQAKRQSLRLGPMVFRTLSAGTYARHRARRVAAGAPDAHVKTPHLLRTMDALLDLERP